MKKWIIFGIVISTLVIGSAVLFISSFAQEDKISNINHSEYEKFYGRWTNTSTLQIINIVFRDDGTYEFSDLTYEYTYSSTWYIEDNKLHIYDPIFTSQTIIFEYEFSDNDTILKYWLEGYPDQCISLTKV